MSGQIFLDTPMPRADPPGTQYVDLLPPAHRETSTQARERAIEDAQDVILALSEGHTRDEIRDEWTSEPVRQEPWEFRCNNHMLGQRLDTEVGEAFEMAARLAMDTDLSVDDLARVIRRDRAISEAAMAREEMLSQRLARVQPQRRTTPKAQRREARRQRHAAMRMTMEARPSAAGRPAPAAPAPRQQIKTAELDRRALRDLQASLTGEAWEIGRRLGLDDPPVVLVADIDTEIDALARYNANDGTIRIAANLVAGGTTTWDGAPLVGEGLAAFVSDVVAHEVAHAAQGDVSDPHGPNFVRAIARLSAIAPMPDRLTRAEFWPFISRPNGYYGEAHLAMAMQRAVDAL